jgi:chromosome segregation ATPase
MTPAPSETAELIIRLRQQLILAQVRIMELEDERDLLAPRLAEIEGLLAAAQKLADGKVGEAAHLTRVVADTQAHAMNLRELQVKLTQELSGLAASLEQREIRINQLEADRGKLEMELQAMKSSRRWRWTGWLG